MKAKTNSSLNDRDNRLLDKLRCPKTCQVLHVEGDELVNVDRTYRYLISPKGIPLFAESLISADSERQRVHYDRVAENYIENLGYPHTIEYLGYLDRVFVSQINQSDLTEVAEICCGHGELLTLLNRKDICGIGVDISSNMLEIARDMHEGCNNYLFVQGDATNLPLQDNQFSGVFMFGGIHHIPDRDALFSEVFRILKPGGKFYFREPVSDFFIWRCLRAIIYYVSPALDAKTERPLLWKETVPLLNKIGFQLLSWRTYGFLGFCFFMNSDVLVFNRFFRFVPGIRAITKIATYLDDLTVKIPGLAGAGLQVIGIAEKPVRTTV